MTDTIVIDWETFYTKEYSLTKMTTQEYVRSPHFEAIGVGIQVNDDEPIWFTGTHDEIKFFLMAFDWENSIAIAHNAVFDASILEWIFDFHPKQWFCTMMAARPLCAPFTPNGRTNLKIVASYLGLGEKGVEALNNIGMTRQDLLRIPGRMDAYGEYCKQDVRLTYGIYKKLAPRLPPEEHLLISESIMKYARPKVYFDKDVLLERLEAAKTEKLLALAAAGMDDPKRLMSNQQFAQALIELGVEPPQKRSITTGKVTWAFAKSDPEFKDLLEHPDPRVQTLVAARFKHKSTIEETRLEKFIRLADLGHPIGIPLLYYGAHTGRFSGMDGLNMQNLPRGSALREAIVAPPGYAIVAADLSQIEARITAALAGQQDLLNVFASGGDPYSYFASDIYGRKITKEDKTERFVGKTAILGLGYGMGPPKFALSVKTLSGIDLDQKTATTIVYTYRRKFSCIPSLWDDLDKAIAIMAGAPNLPAGTMMKIGPVVFAKGHAKLPNGMVIHYPDLRADREGISYNYRGKRKYLWGGALLENIVQALARIILSRAELKLSTRGLRAFMQVHDELVFCVPQKYVDKVIRAAELAMTAPVEWLPGLPVAVECHYGANYKECK